MGDKIKIAFYERFEDEENKWRGSSRTPDAGFHQFVELCGDYLIQDDGSLSLPIMGRFPAAGRGSEDLVAELTHSFGALVGRPGYVNVISVEHQPVFVVGAVKNPGAFKFWQGMTVLHAVALAGGANVAAPETWQSVESVREVENLQRALARAKRLLVRTSLLRAEGGMQPIPSAALDHLVGGEASPLLTEEEAARKLTTQTRATVADTLQKNVISARDDVKARNDRIAPLDSLIALRQERQRAILQLVAHDTVSSPVLAQVQSELADAEDRKRQALIDVASANDRLAEAQHEAEKQRAESAIEIARTTETTERDARDAISDSEGALTLVKALAPKAARSGDLADSFQVVRKTDAGTQVLTLAGTAPLEPGDLVKMTDEAPDDR